MRSIRLISFVVVFVACAWTQNNSYFTTFPKTEAVISEGGHWTSGGVAGWNNVQTNGIIMFGAGPSNQGNFFDATAALTGTWGVNQSLQATVVLNGVPTSNSHEAEIRLHTTIGSSTITGYEMLCSVMSNNQYCQIVRWNGTPGSFCYLPLTFGNGITYLANGNVFKATATGTNPVLLTAWKSTDGGVTFTEIMAAQDSGGNPGGGGNLCDSGHNPAQPFTGGSPGVGFYNTDTTNTWATFGFTNLLASDNSASSTVMSTARGINWGGAGLPPVFADGETTPNPWTPPTRTQCTTTACNTVSSGTVTVASITAAVASAPVATYVLIPAGRFTISGNLYLGGSYTSGHNYVTVRGSGPQSTTLAMSGSAGISIGASSNVTPVNLASSPAQGATSVTLVSGASVPVVGQVAWLEQNSTTSCGTDGLCVCVGSLSCAIQAGGGGLQTQAVRITSVSGATIGFTPGLYLPNWTTAQTARLRWNANGYMAYGMGLENLSVEYANGASQGVGIATAFASWIKGVRLVGNPNGVSLGIGPSTKNSLVANNYITRLTSSAAYEMFVFSGDSDDLILNNIWGFGLLEGGGKSSGNVLAYNYVRDNNVGGNPYGYIQHDGGSAVNLLEGNQMPTARDDDTWGTKNLNTFFRNAFSCWDTPYASNSYEALQIGSYARFENMIGNALGTVAGGSPVCTNYAGSFPTNFSLNVGAGDAHTIPSSFRWGNYAACAGTNCNAVNFLSSENPTILTGNSAAFNNLASPSQTLPASFFMSGSTRPSWWPVCTTWNTFPTSCAASQTPAYPAVGPEVTTGTLNPHAVDIPAVVAWKNLPIDTAYQNSYTVTGSSWSGGIETINISGSFPVAPQGGFTFTGSCGAFSPFTELVMTSSTTTSVSFALAANPGAACTGTIKWPNIRQFDESVYGAAATPAPIVSFSPSSIGFGNQQIQTTSAGQSVSLNNTGTATLTIISLGLSGTDAASFAQSTTCGATLAAGASCTITVTFTPATVDAKSASVSMVDNAAGSPHTVPLTGTGTAPAVTLNPSSLTFTAQTVDTTSGNQPITLTNSGTAPLTITSITPAGDFGQSNNCGSSLAALAACTINVAFTPSGAGQRNGSISITDNAAGSPHTASLVGTGVASSLQYQALLKGNLRLAGNISLGAVTVGGPPLIYAARTDHCIDGSQPDCVAGAPTGKAGAALVFRTDDTDPVPFQQLSAGATANTCFTDSDFGSYECFVTDQATKNTTTLFNFGSGGGNQFSNDGTLLTLHTSGGAILLFDVVPSRFKAHTCAPTPSTAQCFIQSQIQTGTLNGDTLHDSTLFDNKADISMSRSETATLYERTPKKLSRVVVTQPKDGNGTPTGLDTLTRTLLVDFTKDIADGGPVNGKVLPPDYDDTWTGGGIYTMASGGGGSYQTRDWNTGGTGLVNGDTFIKPVNNNVGANWMFQATTPGQTSGTEPVWNVSCPTKGSTCTDGAVTWTNIGNIAGQGPGFDVVGYSPTVGAYRLNTYTGKIFRGTGSTYPGCPIQSTATCGAQGDMLTDEWLACDRLANVAIAGNGSRPCRMKDQFGLHAGGSSGAHYVTLGPSGAGDGNDYFPGVGSCIVGGMHLNPWTGSGKWAAGTSYTFHDLVFGSDANWYDKKSAGTSSSTGDPSTLAGTRDTTNWENANKLCYGYIWDVETTMVRELFGMSAPTGITGGGFSTDVHNIGGYLYTYRGGKYFQHDYAKPVCDAVGNPTSGCLYEGAANPGRASIDQSGCSDSHPSFNNSGLLDLPPAFFPHTDVPTWPTHYTCASYAEETAIPLDGSGLEYRFGHNWNTGSVTDFSIQNAIGTISPMGDMLAWGSDFMGSRGDRVTGATTCANKLRGMYSPVANQTVTYLDTFSWGHGIAGDPNIFQVTLCNGSPSGTCSLGALPNWDTCTPSCTSGGATITNLGPNTCRSDIVVMDTLSAHPVP